MTDRKLLELAPGSRWDGKAVVFDGGDELCSSKIYQTLKDNPARLTAVDPEDGNTVHFNSKDIIALLHRAGLLDELLAEAWDEGQDAEYRYVNNDDESKTPQNPYRKAGENG